MLSSTKEESMGKGSHFIDGRYVESAGVTHEVIDPSNGEVIDT